jgi:hypothetical protein
MLNWYAKCWRKLIPKSREQGAWSTQALIGRCLVTEASTDVVLRQLSRYEGKDRWSVDQLANPDSIILPHGGLLKENVLLSGEVRTAYKTTVALRLQRAFDAAIRKHFVKIQAFYVGPAAEALLDSGCRLTAAEQCPPEFDLRR